jgi:hypothetical protein
MSTEVGIDYLFKLTEACPELSAVRVREGDIVMCENLPDGQKLLMTFSWARTGEGALDPSRAAIYYNVENLQPPSKRVGQPSSLITLERGEEGVQVIVKRPKDGFNPEDIINKVVMGTEIVEALMNIPVSARREVRERLGHQYYDWVERKPTVLDFTTVLNLLRIPQKKIQIIED